MKTETNIKKDETNPCEGCTTCCSYVAIELDSPENEEEYNNIRWYLVHKDVWIFVDHDNSWNIQFNSPCEMLNEKGWCKIYEKRPMICRQYTTKNCEKNGNGKSYKILFKTLKEFEEWFNNGKVIPKS